MHKTYFVINVTNILPPVLKYKTFRTRFSIPRRYQIRYIFPCLLILNATCSLFLTKLSYVGLSVGFALKHNVVSSIPLLLVSCMALCWAVHMTVVFVLFFSYFSTSRHAWRSFPILFHRKRRVSEAERDAAHFFFNRALYVSY